MSDYEIVLKFDIGSKLGATSVRKLEFDVKKDSFSETTQRKNPKNMLVPLCKI